MSLVMKFGGSSVADAPCLRRVSALVRAEQDRGRRPLVVLSAMGKTTNALFEAARLSEVGDLAGALRVAEAIFEQHRSEASACLEGGFSEGLATDLARLREELELLLRGVALLRERSPRSQDAIASFGERLSTRLFSELTGLPLVDARSVLRTNAGFGEAQPDREAIRHLAAGSVAPLLEAQGGAVIQGYIGATEEGLTTTLGRGGSDYSAALLGEALGAEEVQIWTDVEGVLTCDPRVVSGARSVEELSFAEAAELAAFGAKVLHPATIQPALEAGIPVTVRATEHPDGGFTTISPTARSGRAVTAMASRGPVTLLTVSSTRMLNQSGFLAQLFDVFRRHRVSVDLVATAEVSVSLTLEHDAPLAALMEELSTFACVEASLDRAIVALVGERLRDTPGVTGRIFTALGDLNVELISMGANEINLSLVVGQAQAGEALRRLHRALVEEAPCA